MLLAYIDEIGETGAFISSDHARYNTSPAFGYAGFVIPADVARRFGAKINFVKRGLFKAEIDAADHPGRWERKGASIFRRDTHQTFPNQIRAFNGLVEQLRALGGCVFYYADEKPIGTPGQTKLDTTARETSAMQESLNRIARHADNAQSNVMVVIDQINEKTRAERLPLMYSHILGRASDHPEMKRIIEPPMHVDSALSSNIQFAGWIAACLTRAIHYHLIEHSPFGWVTHHNRGGLLPALHGGFTLESKLHLQNYRSVKDLNNSDIVRTKRPLFPLGSGNRIGSAITPEEQRRLQAITQIRAATHS